MTECDLDLLSVPDKLSLGRVFLEDSGYLVVAEQELTRLIEVVKVTLTVQ